MDRISSRAAAAAAAVGLPAVVAEREGAAQHEFPDPVEGREQRRSRGPRVPAAGIGIAAVGTAAGRVRVRVRARPAILVAIVDVGDDGRPPNLRPTAGR
jgi:hypothetical protein